jgi:hypothetical protein
MQTINSTSADSSMSESDECTSLATEPFEEGQLGRAVDHLASGRDTTLII